MTTSEIAATAGVSQPARDLIEEDMSPSQYLELLEQKSLYEDAVRFQAHNLEVRGAITWADACVKELRSPEEPSKENASTAAVTGWLAAPNEQARRQAEKAAEASGISAPEDCVAMAVYLTGSLTPEGAPEFFAPPQASQSMSAAAVLMAVLGFAPERSEERYQKALQLGREVKSGR
jgi:hypothetical protein